MCGRACPSIPPATAQPLPLTLYSCCASPALSFPFLSLASVLVACIPLLYLSLLSLLLILLLRSPSAPLPSSSPLSRLAPFPLICLCLLPLLLLLLLLLSDKGGCGIWLFSLCLSDAFPTFRPPHPARGPSQSLILAQLLSTCPFFRTTLPRIHRGIECFRSNTKGDDRCADRLATCAKGDAVLSFARSFYALAVNFAVRSCCPVNSECSRCVCCVSGVWCRFLIVSTTVCVSIENRPAARRWCVWLWYPVVCVGHVSQQQHVSRISHRPPRIAEELAAEASPLTHALLPLLSAVQCDGSQRVDQRDGSEHQANGQRATGCREESVAAAQSAVVVVLWRSSLQRCSRRSGLCDASIRRTACSTSGSAASRESTGARSGSIWLAQSEDQSGCAALCRLRCSDAVRVTSRTQQQLHTLEHHVS